MKQLLALRKPTYAESVSAALEVPVQQAVQEAFGLHRAMGGCQAQPTLDDYFKTVSAVYKPTPKLVCVKNATNIEELYAAMDILLARHFGVGCNEAGWWSMLDTYRCFEDKREALLYVERRLYTYGPWYLYQELVAMIKVD